MCSGDLRADGAATSVASSPLHFRMDASLDATISAADKRGPAPESQAGGLNLGQLFASRYRIERQLGVGGMGAVYRAQDVELNVPVALKIIRADILSDPATGRDFEERFKQELLLARQITHPNVLRIHDLGQSGGIKYITMPLIEGADLHALLASGPMPFDRVVSLGRQIAAGMAAAHEAGIAHRDLKPQNILVDAAGRAYISDFGLAKSYQASTVGLTRPGDFFGMPRYIAPEIVEGRPADHRSDLYALGLIFYEMASGTLPFVGESTIELLMQRLRTVPEDLQLASPEIPEYFSRIVMRCLERDPAKPIRARSPDRSRYRRPSFAAEGSLAGFDPPSSPDAPWMAVRRRCRSRHRRAADGATRQAVRVPLEYTGRWNPVSFRAEVHRCPAVPGKRLAGS